MADRIFGIMRYHLKPSSSYGCHYSNNYESYDFNRKRLGVFELTPSTLSRIARMKKSIKTLITLVAPFALVVSAHTAFAAGDVAKGEKDFKKCTACHSLEEGKKKIGPTLFKVMGRKSGTVEGFKYSSSYIEAGEKGLVWDNEQLTKYLEDPKGFLKDYLQVKKVKSKMLLKIKKLETRQNIVAYLESLQK